MSAIFSEKTPEEKQAEIEAKLEDLVGEGQKYADGDALAKAYVNADAYIQSQKAERAALEAELKVLKELVETPKSKTPNPDDPEGKKPASQEQELEAQKNEGKEKDIEALIAKKLEERDKEKSFSDNVNAVAEKLERFYGSTAKAQEAVAAKAKELNVGTDWLMDVAGRSPNAFFSTVGLDQRSLSTPNVNSDVNTAAFGRDRSRKNFAYYEEIRKTDPKTYYSGPVQKELLASAREQGEKFYS